MDCSRTNCLGRSYLPTDFYYNPKNASCVDRKTNLVACDDDLECCCDQKCVYNTTVNFKVCSCPSDRYFISKNCRKFLIL